MRNKRIPSCRRKRTRKEDRIEKRQRTKKGWRRETTERQEEREIESAGKRKRYYLIHPNALPYLSARMILSNRANSVVYPHSNVNYPRNTVQSIRAKLPCLSAHTVLSVRTYYLTYPRELPYLSAFLTFLIPAKYCVGPRKNILSICACYPPYPHVHSYLPEQNALSQLTCATACVYHCSHTSEGGPGNHSSRVSQLARTMARVNQ